MSRSSITRHETCEHSYQRTRCQSIPKEPICFDISPCHWRNIFRICDVLPRSRAILSDRDQLSVRRTLIGAEMGLVRPGARDGPPRTRVRRVDPSPDPGTFVDP
jgi:hypothetical protein